MAIAKLETINNLKGKTFFIPSYQRGYRWDETQISELLDDLFEFAQTNPNEDDYYCLQPIVVKKRQDIGENTWEVVDGQQRLTALWFLNLAIDILSTQTISKNSYMLSYEKKHIFSNIFNAIIGLSNTEEEITYRNFLKLCSDKKTDVNNLEDESIFEQMDKCIDGKYVKITFDKIFNYKCDDINDITGKIKMLQRYFTQAKSIGDIISNDKVKIIWYELDGNENTIDTFINLNANKIELSNAELLKARLFCLSDENERKILALQWEEIERGLHNVNLWSFIANKDYISGKYKDSTKIDYLFELYIKSYIYEININKTDRHYVFRIINAMLNQVDANDVNEKNAFDTNKEHFDSLKVKKLWNDILKIYETLCDWYNDYFYYHTIGLLINFHKIDKLKELYNHYSKSTKSSFKNYVLEEIKKCFVGSGKTFDQIEEQTIISFLKELKYGDSVSNKKIKDTLFLYNIATLVNAKNEYERFPFELYKNDVWDIEHIIPQNPENASNKSKIAWFKENCALTAPSKKDVDDAEKDDDSNKINLLFEELFKIDINQFGNLTLLDSNTNKSYKNASFAKKRDTIISIIKNEIEDRNSKNEKYIPVGTKWVFLKGHLTNDSASRGDIVYWTTNDIDSYLKDVSKRIITFFQIPKEDN